MSIKQKLENWGRWASGRLGTEYPAVAAGMLPAPSKFHIPPIDEDEALMIEQVVLLVRPVEPVLYEVLLLTYVYRLKPKQIAMRLNVGVRKYFELVSTANTSVKLMLSQRRCIMLA